MWKLCLKHKKFFILGIFFILLTSFIQISFEFLKGFILNAAFAKDFTKLVRLSFLFFFAFMAKAYTHFLYTRFYFRGKISVLSHLRQNFITRLFELTYPFFIKMDKAEYLFKYTKELDMVESGLFQSWYGLFQIIFEVIFAFIGLCLINYKLAFFSFILLFLPALVPKLIEKILSRYQELSMDADRTHLSKVSEWIRNFEVIKNYSAAGKVEKVFHRDNEKLYAIHLKSDSLYILGQSLSKLLAQIDLLGIIAVSAFFIVKGKLSVGALIIAVGIMEELQSQVIYIAYYIQRLLVTKVPLHSLNSFMKSEISQEGESLNQQTRIDRVKEISFTEVSFSYMEDKKVFENISLSVMKKGLYLVQGESGSGKSTLMNLLLNYAKPDSGSILINGIRVSEIANLTNLVTIFRQEAAFFEDTLRKNLASYQAVDEEELMDILEKLRLNQFANKSALDKVILKNGENFSGGEARRLNLVRSLLRKSDILILDEPFANIDEDTINIIAEIIQTIDNRYIFLITHQLPSKVKMIFQTRLSM